MPGERINYGPLKNARERTALLDILAPTFHFSREHGERYSRIVGPKNYRVVRAGSTVLGGCALLPMGQYFGGRSVPMVGIGAVGIAPEHRGQRSASTLMTQAVLELHRRGVPISVLYPATLPLYRSVGYEQAGVRYQIRIPAKMLNFKGLDRGADVHARRLDPNDDRAVRQCYNTQARLTSGNIDRSDFLWHRVRTPRGQTSMGFAVAAPRSKVIDGYCYYVQKDCPEAQYSLHVSDLVALTFAAARRLLSFFADHRSMTHEIIFQGTPDDTIVKSLPERTYSATLLDHWMLRIINVPAAIAARGYSMHVRAKARVRISDELINDNNRSFTIDVRDGQANVSEGGAGGVEIGIRGLAALYTGHATPSMLKAAGLMTWAARADNDAAALESMFAGPAPWMPDMF